MKVIINGFDVTDVTRSFTPDDWDKLRSCGRHSFVYKHREYPSGRGGRDGRTGNRGGGRSTNPAPPNNDRKVSATAVSTDIVEYDASNTMIATNSSSS